MKKGTVDGGRGEALTLSQVSLSMIAPHTGTRVLYFMKESNVRS